MEGETNTVKAVLYLLRKSSQRFSYTKLQLMLFYYEKEYLKRFGEKVLGCNFLYKEYTPVLEGPDKLLLKRDKW